MGTHDEVTAQSDPGNRGWQEQADAMSFKRKQFQELLAAGNDEPNDSGSSAKRQRLADEEGTPKPKHRVWSHLFYF